MKKNIYQLKKDLNRLARVIKRDLPIVIGIEAVNYSKESFQREGFDGKNWKKSKRIGKANGAAGSRKTLTGHTGDLGRSIDWHQEPGKIVITSDKDYAKIHNEGGRIRGVQHVRAHKRMKNGKRTNVKAHSRKVDFKIPQRQFMGEARELDKILEKKITELIKKHSKNDSQNFLLPYSAPTRANTSTRRNRNV